MNLKNLCHFGKLSILGLLLVANSAWGADALEYTIRWSTDDDRYHVFMRPTVTPTPDASMTAQVTIKVPHGTGNEKFQVSGLTPVVPDTSWSADSRANSPTEDPTSDYLSFSLNASQAQAFNWQAGQEVEVFHFTSTGTCSGPIELLDNNDPFVTPVTAGGENSAAINPGNQFSNLGWADAIGENNYLGNYGTAADCTDSLDSDGDGIINGDEKILGSDPDNADSDSDGIPDGQEVGTDLKNPIDSDGDGIPDYLDSDDNNGPDADADGDGLSNAEEGLLGTDPEDADTDNDGLNDKVETTGPDGNPITLADNTNPRDADSDDDGLSDGTEYMGLDGNPATTADNTDPNHQDSDRDGLQDGTEQGVTTALTAGNSDGSTPVAYNGTSSVAFIPDADPTTTTHPNNPDSDSGGKCDGSLTVSNICVAGEDSNNNGRIDSDETNPMVSNDDQGIQLQLRVLLQGPYDSTTQLMTDDLRVKGILPTEQPYHSIPTNYQGTEQLTSAIAEVTGNDAVVDWVLVELRAQTNPALVIAAKAMLVQRDGDVIDGKTGDTVWQPESISSGQYYVTLRHRNHLDLITATAINLDNTLMMLDFSLSTTLVGGNDTRLSIGDRALMYAGDANSDQRNIANGPNQDSTALIATVLTDSDNQSFSANFVLSGYQTSDLNMDGRTIFAGPDNDTNILLGNVLLHSANSTLSANYILNGSMKIQNIP